MSWSKYGEFLAGALVLMGWLLALAWSHPGAVLVGFGAKLATEHV